MLFFCSSIVGTYLLFGSYIKSLDLSLVWHSNSCNHLLPQNFFGDFNLLAQSTEISVILKTNTLSCLEDKRQYFHEEVKSLNQYQVTKEGVMFVMTLR